MDLWWFPEVCTPLTAKVHGTSFCLFGFWFLLLETRFGFRFVLLETIFGFRFVLLGTRFGFRFVLLGTRFGFRFVFWKQFSGLGAR